MSYDVQIAREPGRHLAVTCFEARPEEMAEKVGPAFGAVIARLGALGIAPAGPAVCVYEARDEREARFRVAAGFVVERPIDSDGTVVAFRLPSTEVVTTTHIGAYEDLGKAYDALASQAVEQGREIDRAAPMWEEYWSPAETPPDQTRTVVFWPLRPVVHQPLLASTT